MKMIGKVLTVKDGKILVPITDSTDQYFLTKAVIKNDSGFFKNLAIGEFAVIIVLLISLLVAKKKNKKLKEGNA